MSVNKKRIANVGSVAIPTTKQFLGENYNGK